MVGRLSGIRTQTGVVATKWTQQGWGVGGRHFVKPLFLRGNAGLAPTFELYPGSRLTGRRSLPIETTIHTHTQKRRLLAHREYPNISNFCGITK